MNKQKLISAALVCCMFSSIAIAHRQISNELSSNAVDFYSAAKMDQDATITEAPTYAPPYISLSKPSSNYYVYEVGESYQIEYEAQFYDRIGWESSNTNIAKVDNTGKVTFYSDGEVTITATATSSNLYVGLLSSSSSVTFTVYPPSTKPDPQIKLDKPKEPLFVGESFKISYYAEYYKDITWKSSDTSIAEVDESGTVTLKAPGTVEITATATSKYPYPSPKSDSVSFTVKSCEPDEPDSTNFSYEVLYDGTIKLTDYTGKSNNIYIPDDIKGIEVKDIGVFGNKTNVVKVSVAGSLYAVPKDAFSNLSFLRFAEIRDGVKAINSGAFSACSNLETVTIPDSVILIADDAFSSNFKGAIEYFSKDSEAYKYATAHGFKTIQHIEQYGEMSYGLENDNEYITIISCDKSVETVNIPSSINGVSVKKIGENAFSNCSELTEITIPDSVKSIGESAFAECYALDKITIKNPDCVIPDSGNTIYNIMDGKGKTFFNGTIYGYENSTAQKYAEKYNRRFVSLGAAPASNIVCGDANCDGQVTIADSTAILQALGNPDKYGLTATGAANADCCNPGDGVTTSDALAIQKLDAKIITALPEIIK